MSDSCWILMGCTALGGVLRDMLAAVFSSGALRLVPPLTTAQCWSLHCCWG